MNKSTKCNCCVKQDVCRYRADYETACEQIAKCSVGVGKDGCILPEVAQANFVTVNISCPFMVAASGGIR